MSTAPTRARRRQTPDETRTLIVDSAERLLRERPFRDLSVDEVMKPTGYRRTVFYRHFTGLPDLVLAVLGRVLPELAQANDAFGEIADREIAEDEIRVLLRGVVEHWERHGPLLIALRDAGVYDAEIDGLIEQTQRRFVSILGEAIGRRQEAGWAGGAAPEQLASALTGMNQRYLMDCFGRPPARASVDEATDALTAIWGAVLGRPA